jgi:predicted nucleotidyltransferase
MSNSSNQTYKDLAVPYFNEVFQIVDEVLTKLEIPYYLIGVSAIALELLKSDIKPSRGTKDIDFAIMIASLKEFDDIVAGLEGKGFHKAKAPWTLFHPDYNVAIDLLPFGQIEENDTVGFNERYTDLHVLGFKEVLSETEQVPIEEKIAQIPPLHGMIILKLISWSDRPEERDNDLKDILIIIKNYYEIDWDEILTNHYDAIPEGDFDKLIIAARVLGRKAAEVLSKSKRLEERVLEVLRNNSENIRNTPIGEEWAQQNDWTVEYAVQIIKEFMKGILETISK